MHVICVRPSNYVLPTRSSTMVSSPLPGVRIAMLYTLNAACTPFTFFACMRTGRVNTIQAVQVLGHVLC